MKLTIKRGATVQAVVEIDEKTIFTQEFMGDDRITTEFIVTEQLDLQVSDYIEYRGDKYSIVFKYPPKEKKDDAGNYTYTIMFFGPLFFLYNKQITHNGDRKFAFTDTPVGFMTLLINCIREIDTSWTLGDVELIAEPELLEFEKTSCRAALTMIADKFKLEYYVVQKKIYLVRNAGTLVDAVTFRHGRGKGLYELTKDPASNSFATVWIGEGGSKNLPENYGLSRLSFTGNPITIPGSLARFGYIEDTVTFEDIYPQRTAVAQTAGKINDDEWYITDSTIDFDYNGISIPDSTKIVFKTGDLGNEEFVIKEYIAAEKKIIYYKIQEDSGYILPNDVLKATPGDKYTLINIFMPQSYVDAAELLLKQKTQEHADEHCIPQFTFSLYIDEHFVRLIGYENKLKAGDRIPVADSDMGLATPLRIQTLEWPLVNPAVISASISDVVKYTTAEELYKSIVQTKALSRSTFLVASSARARANTITQLAANAQTTANNAVIEAQAANEELEKIASDNVLSAGEKQTVLMDVQAIIGEVPIIDAQATNYAIDRSDYDAKAMALVMYTSPLLADLTTDSAIVGPTFRAYFKNYYDAKITLLKAISDKAKVLANNAQATANQAVTDAAAAYLAAGNAQTAADQAVVDAAAANSELADIANDNVLTVSEKPRVLLDVQIIQNEKPTIVAQALTYGINSASYESIYADLIDYVTPLLAQMDEKNTIDGGMFRYQFNNYYTAKIDLLKAISDITKSIADDANATSEAARLFAQQVGDDVYNSAAFSMFQKTTITDLSVLSSAFVVGNPIGGAVAALDGTATQPTDIVISVGSAFDDRENADFKVLLNGKTFMTDAEVSGVINALSGHIGNWQIDPNGLYQIGTDDAYIIQRKVLPDGKTIEARIGTNIFPAATGVKGVGFFENNEVNPGGSNYGIYINITGAENNTAIGINSGDVLLENGKVDIKGALITAPKPGESISVVQFKSLPTTNSIAGKNYVVADTVSGQLFRLI